MAANSIKCRNLNLFILMIKFFNYFFEGEEKKKMKLADNGIWLCEGKGLDAQNFKIYTND